MNAVALELCSSCGRAKPRANTSLCPLCLLDAPLPPSKLDEYLELHELIGEGAMGAVFRARDLKLNRDVAVKLLPGERDEDTDELSARLLRESRALSALTHPGIVVIHSTGESEGQPYLVMQLIDGENLRVTGPHTPEETRSLGIRLAEALSYAHERGIVHRDVKPENIIIRADGSPVLIDFGIARAATRGQDWTVTQSHLAAGSPSYMSPESLRGEAPDPRMDLYSMGVVLYERLTGELPQGAFAPLPEPWDPVIRRALAPNPEDRFSDAAAMGRALAGLRLGARDGEDGAKGQRLASDEGSFIRALAALQTVATAVTIWALYECIMPRAIAPEALEPITMLPVLPPLDDGRIVTLARFLPGPFLAAVLANALAVLAYGFLRRHWRREGIEVHAPELSVSTSRAVLLFGVLNVGGFLFRLAASNGGFAKATAFVPIVGGISEAVTIYLAWLTVLEGWRRNRPLYREWRLWIGLGLSAVPPLSEYVRYVSNWSP